MSKRIKVLYISGWGRSGSTILGNLLGQIDGVHHIGEFRVWDAALLEGRHCGCGSLFADCPFWSRVLEAALGHVDAAAADRYRRQRLLHTRFRHVPTMLRPGGADQLRAKLADYLEVLEKLYAEIARVGEIEVIVDSSKFATYGWLLSLIGSIDLRILHLVRDPRAVAYSWTRKKVHGDIGRLMRRHSPGSSALLWSVWNASSELLFRERSLRVKYEDFIQRPLPVLREILQFIDEAERATDFVRDHEATLTVPNHTVLGNPNRFAVGTVQLREDREWSSAMGLGSRALVGGITSPLRLRYGY